MRFDLKKTSAILALSLLMGVSVNLSAMPAAFAQSSSESVRNYNEGIEAYNAGRRAEALKKFETATRLNPAYGDAYYNMGSIYFQMKNFEDAREMFQKAVNLNPGDGQARYNLALCLEKQNRLEEAVSVYAQITASDPKYSQARSKMDDLKSAIKTQVAAASGDANSLRPSTAASTAVSSTSAAAPAKLKAVAFSRGYDGPTGIVIGPGGFMYVANYSKNLIYKVGANGDKTIFAQGETLIKGPIGMAYNPKSNELYVANYLLNNVVRITAGGKVSTIVPNLTKPYNLFLDTVNNALFISEQDPANIVSRVSLPKP
jgi:tetratricopeptide (TPR) repeat protein